MEQILTPPLNEHNLLFILVSSLFLPPPIILLRLSIIGISFFSIISVPNGSLGGLCVVWVGEVGVLRFL